MPVAAVVAVHVQIPARLAAGFSAGAASVVNSL
jgi:hypothetical protein